MFRDFIVQGEVIKIDVSDKRVFQPHPITLMLANAIRVKTTDVVLEVCSGSGIISITAAKLGASKVFSSDISGPAVYATRRNATLNGINGQMMVVKGDFFEPFKGRRFDVIVANPPCMPFPDGEVYLNRYLTNAVNGGLDGTNSMLQFLNEAVRYLAPGGRLFLPVPEWSDSRRVYDCMGTAFSYTVLSEDYVPYYLAEASPVFAHHFKQIQANRIFESSENGSASRVAVVMAVSRAIASPIPRKN